MKTIKAPLKIDPLFILMALVLLAFAWRAVFIYRPIEWVTNFWLFEDFGYSLKIARNIALGLGETFDGVVFTSGYQPLYVWLMVPVFWIFPKNLEIPVYLAETLLAICNSVTVVFIYAIVARLTKRQWSGIAAAALWAFNLAIARNGSLGLETGLSTMMVAATMAYVVSLEIGEHATRKALALGALLGVTFLARVETEQDRASFLARLSQVYANPAYLYTIYRIGSEPYKAIRKPEPAAGWAETSQPYATFRHALVSATPGARVAFSSDRPFDLRFLRQASSGMANVYRDGVLLDTVDLYAPVFDSTYKFPVSGDGQVHRYEVEVAQETNAGSTSHQVWFDAILER